MKTETDGIFATQILVNAIDEEGRRVHIADVVKGDGRVYRCPSPVCGHQVLIPKKGEIVRHHFAHKSGRGCKWAVDAGIADLVFDILQAEKKMLFPALVYFDAEKGEDVVISPSRMLRVEEVRREEASGRPVADVVITVRVGADVREFVVIAWLTHAPTQAQIEALRSAGRECVGVDLAKLYRARKKAAGKHLDGEAACAELQSAETLGAVLLEDGSCKSWLFNRKAADASEKSVIASEERERREAEKRAKREAERRARDEKLRQERAERLAAVRAAEKASLAERLEKAEARRAAELAEEKERRLRELSAPSVADRSNEAPVRAERKRELGAFPGCWVWRCPSCGTDDQVVRQGSAEAECRRCKQRVTLG